MHPSDEALLTETRRQFFAPAALAESAASH